METVFDFTEVDYNPDFCSAVGRIKTVRQAPGPNPASGCNSHGRLSVKHKQASCRLPLRRCDIDSQNGHDLVIFCADHAGCLRRWWW
jgi:hypothetical protein